MSSVPAFVHLRTHSELSVVDGILPVKSLVAAAKADGQVALALTDLGNLFGQIRFYQLARQQGIKPLIGCDFWVSNEDNPKKPFRLLLLARNHNGYLRLCDLISRSYLENQREQAQLRKAWLVDTQDLIALSGGLQGDVAQALAVGNIALAKELLQDWQARFPGAFYIELQRIGAPGEQAYLQAILPLAQSLGLPVVATQPVQFLRPEDMDAHETRVCIAQGETLASPTRLRRFTAEQYFKSTAQMQALFADIPSALQNTVEIAKRCNVTLSLGKPQLPDFPTPNNIPIADYLLQLANEGLQKRLQVLYPDPAMRAQQTPTYQQRLDWECQTIIDMGFPGYFLIVQDFINWAKNNGIPVGPGRGSGAGSLVAYALGITDLDPLRYDLLFERFLNPERVSMPDFDIDFCQDNRDKVIDYVKEKYGHDAVSQIATFGTLGAKAVVRDVGRVLELPYGLCDSLSKLIPFSPTDPWSLERAMKEAPDFARRYEEDEEVRAIVDMAKPLEGLTRNVGMHAGGVLIAPGKLTDFCPLFCQPGSQSAVSQYDKNDIESVGLVKFDFLGLRNLTIVDWAVRYVRQFNPDKADFDIMQLPLDDPGTYDLLSAANTTAVFQLESPGMKNLLLRLKPSTFEDIIAVLALFRPGPLESGMVDDFVKRKHGQAPVDYFHPDLEDTLNSTYGVIVYQEQVMLISQIIGGYSLGGADLLRRAMGKKKPEEMQKHRAIFQEGAVAKGYDADLAVRLFDLMEKFAGYGFNKSHSAAYALVAYQTAWLKCYHPAEFMAATLSSDMDNTDKVQGFWRDALSNGLTILPPDINQSEYRFTPVLDAHSAEGRPPKTIRYGLGAVKGVGQAAIEAMVKVRQQGGPFSDLYDFCQRVDRHALNRRSMEALIKAGAFDSLESNRAALLENLGTAIAAAEQREANRHQASLFADDVGDVVKANMNNTPAWDLLTQLQEEKQALGFYFSHHLFDVWRDEVRRFVPSTLLRLREHSSPQWVAGILQGVRSMERKPKPGQEGNVAEGSASGRFYLLSIDDGSAQCEISCNEDLYQQYRHRLHHDQLLLAQVMVRGNGSMLRLQARSLHDLQSAREAHLFALVLPVVPGGDIATLKRLLNPFRASPETGQPGVPVYLRVEQTGDFHADYRLSEEWRVRLPDDLFSQLQDAGQPYELHYVPWRENQPRHW